MLCLRNNYILSEAPSKMKRQYKMYCDVQDLFTNSSVNKEDSHSFVKKETNKHLHIFQRYLVLHMFTLDK